MANESFCWTLVIFFYFKLYDTSSKFILLGDDYKTNDIQSNLRAVGCPYNICVTIAHMVISCHTVRYYNSQVSYLA